MSTGVQPRSVRPALFYVLAAFGLVIGAFGTRNAVVNALSMTAPRDVYVRAIVELNQSFKPMIPDAELETWGKREGETRYDRRNAALPLAIVGGILSALLLAGCLRAMRGDPWGLSAWALAASAGIPYQLISTALAVATTRDLTTVFAQAPASVMMLVAKLQLEMLGALVLGGLAIVYFGSCVLYLRNIRVRRVSDGGRTPPSA
jgi:hypothetical protein